MIVTPLHRTLGLRRALDDILLQPRYLLILRMTALLLLLHGATRWTLDVPLRIVCGAMLLSPVLLTTRWLWFGITGALVAGNLLDWAYIDNHKYLMVYWCAACTLAVASDDPDRVLGGNGRVLLGLVFSLAVLWKLMAGEYLNGEFLHFTFLQDARLEVPVRAAGDLDPSVLSLNRLLKAALASVPHPEGYVELTSNLRLRAIALVASYWTFLIEGALAVAFLAPRLFRRATLVHPLLMTFIATTYFLLPVTGFAFALVVLALSCCPTDNRRIRIAYLGMLVAIQLTRIPWQDLV